MKFQPQKFLKKTEIIFFEKILFEVFWAKVD